jgi:hypothetical protein
MAEGKKPSKREVREEAEKRFLSALLDGIFLDGQRETTACFPGVAWRDFRDKRHRVIWRALERLDICPGGAGDISRRVKVLEEEEPGLDSEELVKAAGDCPWLERELAKAGVLSLAGGKAYIRKLYAAWPVILNIEKLAGDLGFRYVREKSAI